MSYSQKFLHLLLIRPTHGLNVFIYLGIFYNSFGTQVFLHMQIVKQATFVVN